jgi:hypothetical protein
VSGDASLLFLAGEEIFSEKEFCAKLSDANK